MGTDIKIEMLEASNPREGTVQLVKQAMRTLLKMDDQIALSMDDLETADKAKDVLLTGIAQLRVSDIALAMKDFVEQGQDTDVKTAVLNILNERIDDPTFTTNERAIDYLALASIYEDVDPKKSRELNASAYFHLGSGQNNYLGRIVTTFEDIANHYPDGDYKRDFTLSISQMQDLDKVLIAKTKDFLASDKKDPEIAERLARLLYLIEDDEIYSQLTEELFDHRTPAGQTQYLQDLLNNAATDNASDDAVDNGVLARYGKTYGDVFATIAKSGEDIGVVLGYKPNQGQQQRLNLE